MNARRSPTTTLLRRGHREPQPHRPAGEPSRPGPTAAGAQRRQADVPQDRALYTCSCGYVFAATVSTSVGCPHCGDSQAW